MRRPTTLFALAAAYFACYVPYSALTKALADHAGGLALLPVMTVASLAGMVAVLAGSGWWRSARPAGARWPRPTRWTALSGAATALILVTTTLAYTFEGVSLTFVMLVMRGGVLVIAPVVDGLSGRRIRWFSWAALGLSLGSLATTVASHGGAMPLWCAVDLGAYLASYLVRLRLMSRLGKSDDPAIRRRYFVEEQLVATPAALALVGALAWLGPPGIAAPLRDGFAELAGGSRSVWLVLAGLCSQGTGIFGGLMLLDASEASYCVPLNRAASILGGVVAAFVLACAVGAAPPSPGELAGAALLIVAIGALWRGPATPTSSRPRSPAGPRSAPRRGRGGARACPRTRA